jgi:hypothetical protein
MIQVFVDRFMAGKGSLRETWRTAPPKEYADIVKAVIKLVSDDESDYSVPDPERVHQIDDGDYQGTLVFVIGATGYQPSDYWYARVSYGSCSGCDTLEAIMSDGGWDEPPSESQLDRFLTLALHVVQQLKAMGGYEDVV